MSHFLIRLSDCHGLILESSNGDVSALLVPIKLALIPFLQLGLKVKVIQGNAFPRFPSHPLGMEALVHGFDLGSTSVAEEIRVDRVAIGRMPRRGEVKDVRYWTELGTGDNRGLVVGGERSYLSLRTGCRVGLAVWHRWKGHRREGLEGIWSVRG